VGIIDSQSVKTAHTCAQDIGYDAGKRIKGRKRHIVTFIRKTADPNYVGFDTIHRPDDFFNVNNGK
jgi:molybdopterin-guanine dinucleotide biosynthesis protein A